MVHFLKEIVSNSFLVAGAPVPFEVLDGNIGVIALEENEANRSLIAELSKNCGRFGISKLSQADYELKKNQPPLIQSRRSSPLNEKLRVVQTRQPTNPFARQIHQAAPEGAAAAANGGQQVAPAAHSTVPGVPPAPPAKTEAPPESNTGMAAPKFVPSTRRISRRAETEATDAPTSAAKQGE